MILSLSDRKKILLVMLIQISFGVLDLIGVAIIGVLGALTISGIESLQPGNRVGSVLRFLSIDKFTFQSQAIFLGLLAAFFLVSRTILSIVFTRKILFFLSMRGAQLSSRLVAKLLKQPLLLIQSKTSQETSYAVTTGVSAITMGILSSVVNLVSDGSLLLVMSLGLFVVNPLMAVFTFLIFASIGLVLYYLLHTRALNLGRQSAKFSIASNQRILEVLHAYRETVVSNRRDYYSREIGALRTSLASAEAEQSFLPYIGKYVIESSVILGALVVSATQFILSDATHAVATLSIFLAAGTRIAPAVLRLQQGAVSIKGNIGIANPTLDLIEKLINVSDSVGEVTNPVFTHENFDAEVEIKDVAFSYPPGHDFSLQNISLRVNKGELVAIVGPSGAGKTTLIDLLLGVLEANSGIVKISNTSPLSAINKFPGAIAYVPQNVEIFEGTIRQNVMMGFEPSASYQDEVIRAIELAQLSDLIADLPHGLDSYVGERGSRLSGGQRQRLGIARALFTNPNLLIMDESTSALDGQTEIALSTSLQNLRGDKTILLIAHRLSTVRQADQIIYLENGQILSVGTFEQVRAHVPDFDLQAKLMGL
jgi:ABC-type multidrug transport system fused ATPase/permease subunit